MRKEVPLFITFLFGAFMILDFFVPHHRVTMIGEMFKQWTVIITAFAFVLGVANLARINLHKLTRQGSDRFYAGVLLFGLFGMLGAGLIGGIESGSFAYDLFEYVFTPMQATMFSLLAFFIASAAFRAFRVRSLDAGLLALTALLVMIGRVPVGDLISDRLPESWPSISAAQGWIMNVPNLAAKRAILIGAALGAISTGLKIIVGVERNYLGE